MHRKLHEFDGALLRCVVGIAFGLAVLHLTLALLWGPGPVIAVLPWYAPMISSFVALAALSVAFLSFGRYQVLHEPVSFWIGMAFSAFAILAVFYILSWPGLLPDDQGLIASLPNTSSWFWHLQFSALAIFLLAAAFVPWPRAGAAGERWWLPLVVAAMAVIAVVGVLAVVFERLLPLLVVAGAFTDLNVTWMSALALAFAATILLSAYRYRKTGNSLYCYAAIAELLLVFGIIASLIGGRRYDLWWYWQRILWVGGFSVMLFGLLSEYVGLFRREQEKARQLETLQQLTDPTIAREGLEPLLENLLGRTVAIMGANAGAIWLCDPARQELVLRKAAGIPEEEAVGLRMRVGEDFAGRVAAQNTVFWVRDAQADPAISSPYIRSKQIRAMLGAPMRVGAHCIGVVHVDFLVPREFAPHEERLLAVVAERAALAIYQARLLEEAQEERNHLQVLINTTPAGIILHSAPDGRPLLSNKAAEIIMGQSLRPDVDVTRQPAFYGIHRVTGEPFPPEELPASRSLRGETCLGVEMLVRQPSGREVYVLANSAPLRDAQRQIVGAVVAFYDITPIKEQERLRDEFISTAAHELRTPVTTIKGYVQLMHKWAPAGHEPREGAAFTVIDRQCDRINRRVQEMLEAVRFRRVPLELRRARFDLAALASQAAQRMQATTHLHRLTVRRHARAMVEGDRERIEEVLESLLDNAIKFSPEGGAIEVQVRTEADKAVVSVKDHGLGISAARQPHIFEPFYEIVPAGAPGYRGVVPLSLYLSKLAIERHKGRIWFESEEGKGSTFYFSLPLAPQTGA